MIRCIIIEDEEKSLRVVQNLIQKYFDDRLKIQGNAASVEQGIELIKTINPDLIFLDIELVDGSSFSILKQFSHPKFSVIFTTAFDNYAIKAFKFSAIDYLLKPIDDDEFQEAVHKYIQSRTHNLDQAENISNAEAIYHSPKDIYNNKLAVRSLHQTQFVQLRDIIALEAEKNYTKIITEGACILSSKNLGYYEELIVATSNFIRVHHSTIINIHYIQELLHSKSNTSLEVVMNNGSNYIVSVRKAGELKKLLRL